MLDSTREMLLNSALEFDRAVAIARQTCTNQTNEIPCQSCLKAELDKLRTSESSQPDSSAVEFDQSLHQKSKPRQRTA